MSHANTINTIIREATPLLYQTTLLNLLLKHHLAEVMVVRPSLLFIPYHCLLCARQLQP